MLPSAAAAQAEGRYLVIPQGDGSLEVRALEVFGVRPATPERETSPIAGSTETDDEAAERELSRWGRRALGDLAQTAASQMAPSSGHFPIIDPRQEDQPQPASLSSMDPAARQSALSAVPTDWFYWVVQNRDAHSLFKTRQGPNAHPESEASATRVPSAPPAMTAPGLSAPP